MTTDAGTPLEFHTPNHHTFVRVPHQTGCERCGYPRGQHPTKRQLASFWRHRANDPHCTCNDCIGYLADHLEAKQ